MVLAIVILLLAIFAPGLHRLFFVTRSTLCGTYKGQIIVALCHYAGDNNEYFPARWPNLKNSYNHAYWFGVTNNANRDMHEEIEQYFGPSADGGPPTILVCPVEPRGIWGRKIDWPLVGIYRTNVTVYAGYDWSTTSASACVPHASLDQMPQRLGRVPHRPLAGDLIEYMSGNSASGYSGWDTAHTFDPRYHVRSAGGPEDLPPDPIPFAYGDGSVRFTLDLEPCYTDKGWGTNYWPVPDE